MTQKKSVIYETSGRAREYNELAINLAGLPSVPGHEKTNFAMNIVLRPCFAAAARACDRLGWVKEAFSRIVSRDKATLSPRTVVLSDPSSAPAGTLNGISRVIGQIALAPTMVGSVFPWPSARIKFQQRSPAAAFTDDSRVGFSWKAEITILAAVTDFVFSYRFFESKVVIGIVPPVFVVVVNKLRGQQRTSELLAHNVAMLIHKACARVRIWMVRGIDLNIAVADSSSHAPIIATIV